MTWRTSESWRHLRITNIFLDDIEKIWTWGCRCGWLVEVGGWRVYVSRGNSSRFWGDFAPCLPTSSYIAPAPIHQHSGTHCGGGGAWRKLLVAVTGHFGDAAEDRDLNFSPLAQSTNSQLRLFSFTWAGLSNPDLIWVPIKVKQFALIGSGVILSLLWMFQTWSQRTHRNQDETRSFKKTRDSRRCKSKWCSFLVVCSKYLVRVEIMFWWNWACHPDNSWVMWTYQPKYQAAQNIGKRRNYI